MNNFIKNRFGSKKGLLSFVKFNFFFMLGKYKIETRPDLSKINRFVFVCSGNICRSPLAEIVMKKAGFNSISFGLSTRGGDMADMRTIDFGKANGFDISNHCTKPIEQYIPQENDLLVGMEPKHIVKLHAMFPDTKTTALGLWLPHKTIYLHDPYSANITYFNKCAEKIVIATNNLYKKAVKNDINT